MRRFNFLMIVFASWLMFFSFSTAKGQDEVPPGAPNREAERPNRPNLLAELGLSIEQREQIRRVNTEKKPMMRNAQQRLREANRNLDQAIYADNLEETEIQARLKNVQTAQADLIKIRVANELAVRKILTVEQLAKFRALREQFAQMLENDRDNPQKSSLQNLKRGMRMRQNRMRPNN